MFWSSIQVVVEKINWIHFFGDLSLNCRDHFVLQNIVIMQEIIWCWSGLRTESLKINREQDSFIFQEAYATTTVTAMRTTKKQ